MGTTQLLHWDDLFNGFDVAERVNFYVQINLRDLERDVIGDKSDVDVVALGLNLDSGLGVFDAFVASFSMIMVSEVCECTIFNIVLLFCLQSCKHNIELFENYKILYCSVCN